MITQQRLKSLINYNPETGIFIRISSGKVVGTVTGRGYVFIHVDGKLYQAHRLAFIYMCGEIKKEHIDHINKIRSDNRFINLRLASRNENFLNSKKHIDNTSGFKGVSENGNRWRAKAMVNGKSHCLGNFKTAIEASEAYKKFALQNHGEFYCES